jgi:hypothetical protein
LLTRYFRAAEADLLILFANRPFNILVHEEHLDAPRALLQG